MRHVIEHRSNSAKTPPPNDRPPAPAPPRPPAWRVIALLLGIILTAVLLFTPSMTKSSTPTDKLNYTALLNAVGAGQVKTATIDPNGKVTGRLANGHNYKSQIPTVLRDTQITTLLKQNRVQITGKGPGGTSALSVLLSFLPLLFFIGVFVWLGRRARRQITGGIMGFGGSKARLYDEDRPKTRFNDVAGYENAKAEVQEVVDFLKRPERYLKAGAVGPKGVLMVGPPGTGKTLMARAVAGEAEVPFLALTGSSFVELFVGVGASRVRDLFADARKRAPSIIFIDEIDAIGGRRGGSLVSNDEREQTLNQLLAEMDGFDPATGVVVIAATNRVETLDPALLRPGRFDRTVEIPLPNQRERAAILGVHVRGKKLADDVDLDVVARGTPGFSGADLANLVNEAAINAVRGGRDTITADDFSRARDRILLGHRDAMNALLPEEKHSVAVHESGHAVVAVLSEHADPVEKVTILPAGQTLGVTEQLPEVERHLYPESYLRDSLAVRLGGRAAELLVLGEASSGAASDLAGATQLATKMVRDWGLSPRLGPIGFADSQPGVGADSLVRAPYAEATQQVIDEEVSRLLREAEATATELLRSHRARFDTVVDALLQHETINGETVRALIEGDGQGAVTPAASPAPVGAGASGHSATGHSASRPRASGSGPSGGVTS